MDQERKIAEMVVKMTGELDFVAIKRCVECRGCENDCPSFKLLDGYDPTKMKMDILAFNMAKWLESDMIWQCLECHTCSERCPQGHSWEKVFTKLKSAAMELGFAPKSVARGMSAFVKTGMLGLPKSGRVRDKLGLPPANANGGEDFKILCAQLSGDVNES